ncbi:hypothetical protein ADK78_13350 [Kitasatospora aureofaciens]|uniref:Phosphotyrosine protein phosphatase I domain-containing protein n=1 Tax=Streptomyces rimosus subsp. rimosus TaxID=132474 RepID=A0ABY3YY06_STRRM|nr:hypothetical protein ADK78_13350 [Kitasatospora aureofaciens]KOT43921.1 hypothetical protein ADK42_06170 [Streptomyces rimosus subsp. rimosus]KOT67257.1 hypothetical protein ADK44_03550 [Streptomyces rimosus subsp. rimosus]KOT69865.1 hypothetical protein ADK45_05205 [Streptomyces rimosus subsp. rimosus]KOT90563.1 hypothetical protein ADK48_03170 [Streptomyces rimosus subsp. rimosus]
MRAADRPSRRPHPSQNRTNPLGCGDAGPVVPGRRYPDWPLEDPAGQGVDAVRPIRDGIRARVEALIAEIDARAAR